MSVGMNVTIFVPDLPDFMPVIEGVKGQAGVQLLPPKAGYWQVQAPQRISFTRKGLGLRVALWYSMLAGGFCGKLREYTRDQLVIEAEQ